MGDPPRLVKYMIKETLLRQFTACYDTNNWFVAVRNAIEDVTFERAAWKPEGSDENCIWEILSHLTYYNYAYLQRFKGLQYEYDLDNNDQTFSTGEYAETDWQADVARFDAVMKEWRELIAAASDAKFGERVSDKNAATWAEVIADVNAHNAYHGGQIVLLRKLQGSWIPSKGVS